MVNQRDTSISKLLLLPDPSRSPKRERRNDLFVNIVSTLIVWRESAWKSTPTLKGTGALEKDTWPQGARETVSDSPTKKISSQLSIFSSLLEYSHVLAEQSNALSLHLSLSLSRRELTSPQQKKKIIQNGSSLFRSIPTGGVFPRFFFFFLSLISSPWNFCSPSFCQICITFEAAIFACESYRKWGQTQLKQLKDAFTNE